MTVYPPAPRLPPLPVPSVPPSVPLVGLYPPSPSCPLSHRGEPKLLQRVRPALRLALHEVDFLLPLRGPRAFLGPPLPVEAQVPSFVLGRHQRRVVVLQEFLDEHALLLPSVELREGEERD